MTSERVRKIEEKAIEEFRSFFVMALYLWLVFGLMMLNEAVILNKPSFNFLAQGFAIVNALVLAKVMLVADDLGFGRELDHLPLIWPIVYKAAAYGLLRSALDEGSTWSIVDKVGAPAAAPRRHPQPGIALE